MEKYTQAISDVANWILSEMIRLPDENFNTGETT